MTTSYSTSLATPKDQIRLAIGDTDITAAIYSDEEITATYTAQGSSVLGAAAVLADGAAAKYARRATTSIDGLTVQFSSISQAFRDLATRLRLQAVAASGGLGTPVVAGVSQTAMDAVDADTDRTPSRFVMGQDDNPAGALPVVPDRILP